MSSLDKQLFDIITEIQRDEHRNGTTSDDERIAQIHSAFTDAGYVVLPDNYPPSALNLLKTWSVVSNA